MPPPAPALMDDSIEDILLRLLAGVPRPRLRRLQALARLPRPPLPRVPPVPAPAGLLRERVLRLLVPRSLVPRLPRAPDRPRPPPSPGARLPPRPHPPGSQRIALTSPEPPRRVGPPAPPPVGVPLSGASRAVGVTALQDHTYNAAVLCAANSKPKVLIGNALYFTCHCESTVMILRCDLASRELSIINGPAGSQPNHDQYVLAGMDNGVLGFANVQMSTLCVWSIEASANGRTVAWGQQRVVELERLLPPHVFPAEFYVTGFTEGVGVIVLTNAGTFTIELKAWGQPDNRELLSSRSCSRHMPSQLSSM